MISKLQSLRVQILGVAIVLALVLAAVAFAPAPAAASTYVVHQCTAQQGTVDDAVLDGHATGYSPSNACGFPNGVLEMRASGAVGAGLYRQWSFSAPDGTRMNSAAGHFQLQGASNPDGHNAYVYVRSPGGNERFVAQLSHGGSTTGNYDSSASGGPVDRIGVGITCTHSAAQGNCNARPEMNSRVSDLTFQMQDTVAPERPVTGGSALAGWVAGTKSVNFDVADSGAGVVVTGTGVNGQVVDFDTLCSPSTDSSGAAKQLKPCPTHAGAGTSFDVAQSPFRQGSNSLLVCVSEYGSNPQATCRTDEMLVDTIAPEAPMSLAVTGGEGWRRDDAFDLTWRNAPQAHAPIVGAVVRVTGPNGFDRTTFHPGADRSSIDDLTVPVPGDFTASVYLRDAAGNESLAGAGVVHLRFDDTVPARSMPDAAAGWLSRAEVAAGYRQGWSVTPPAERPPSGIAGYRVIVNRNSDTDPCSGADDQRACAGPITEVGPDSAARILGEAALPEGENFVHVAVVSGSGMRSTQVGHARIPVDLSDPAVALRGDGNGEWMDHDANLQAVASDAVSGMSDTGEFAADAPPQTVLTVNGQTHADTDANVSAMVNAEGTHQVSYFAQDLAGNANDGTAGNRSPSHATVRIDKTAPALAFTNSQDPDDPDRLVAPVADALSGVAEGRISYRQLGGGEWKALETVLRDGELTARVDSGDLRPGVTYEFRAIASDRAGNATTSASKANGEPMRVTGPFRTLTGVVDLAVNGKRRAKVGYRRPATVSGRLVGSDGGGAVAGATVTLTEKFLQGSRRRIRTSTVTTNGSGAFSAKLRRGPSRKIVASYGGDRRFLGTVSAPAKLGVRSRVSLRVDSTASAAGRSVFTGRVRAKGTRFGKAGKRLEVQVRVGRGWRAVGKSFRTDRSGRYRLAYEFTGAYEQPVTYRFRAAVLRQRGLPYLRSTSRKRSVTVRP